MRVETTQLIDRPVADVFRFFADNHVRNHPRWDPDVALEQISPGPIGVGTLIRRRVSRYATPSEGQMEVVTFDRERAFATVINDGPVAMRGGADFEPLGDRQTKLTIWADVEGAAAPELAELFRSRMARSASNIKDLIEAET